MSDASSTVAEAAAYQRADKGDVVLVIAWLFLTISTIVVGLRVYVKLRGIGRLYWDDALMLAALVLAYVHAGFLTEAVHFGLGRHFFVLDNHQQSEALKVGIFTLVFGTLSALLARLGFCVFLLYVSGTDPLIKKWTIHLVIWLQVITNVTAVVLLLAECGTHITVLWTSDLVSVARRAKYCMAPDVQSKYGYFYGSFNTLVDLYLTILPGMVVMHTKLRLKEKIGLMFCLCLSIVALIASAVKTYEARALAMATFDYSYELVPYMIWIALELNIVMIVSTIPLLRPVVRSIRDKYFRKTGNSQKHWESVSMGSMTKSRARSGVRSLSPTSSEEHITGVRSNTDPNGNRREQQEEEMGITRTTEVTVTYAANNIPFVHAALVGLVQGEQMAGPR